VDQLRAELAEKGLVYRSKHQALPRTVPSIWRRSDHVPLVTDVRPIPELSYTT